MRLAREGETRMIQIEAGHVTFFTDYLLYSFILELRAQKSQNLYLYLVTRRKNLMFSQPCQKSAHNFDVIKMFLKLVRKIQAYVNNISFIHDTNHDPS